MTAVRSVRRTAERNAVRANCGICATHIANANLRGIAVSHIVAGQF
jgi:hypothetical protein